MSQNKVLGTGGVHHVAVRTADLDASVAFYTGVLGMTVAAAFELNGARFVHLDTGDGSRLELMDDGQPVAAADERNVHWHFCLGTTRLSAVVAAVEQAGMQVTMGVTPLALTNTAGGEAEPMPIEIAFFTGPGGEVVELLQAGG